MVLLVGVALTACTGVGLVAAADRTGEFWAWTIGNPLTAASMGAGYVGAATGLVLAFRANEWTRARPVLLAALTLTSLALLATLRHLDEFALDEGAVLQRAVAWMWLGVYAALPPLLAAIVVLEERRGGRPDPPAPGRVGPGTIVLAAAAVALAAFAGALLLGIGAAADAWPWPLPPLPAEVVGAWLAAFAVLVVAAVLPRNRRVWRDPALAAAVTLALLALSILRFASSLD